jgi:hypothetical protein
MRSRSVVTDNCNWHPWLRINRVLRVMLHTRWNAEAWAVAAADQRQRVSPPSA